MRRMLIVVMVAAGVLALTHLAPPSARAQSVIGLTCWSYATDTTVEEYGVVSWTLWSCVDYLSTRTGVPPITFGDAGFCDERPAIGVVGAQRLDCDWHYRPRVADAMRSYRDSYCQIIDREYGFQNRQNIGYIFVGCADRDAFVRALIG